MPEEEVVEDAAAAPEVPSGMSPEQFKAVVEALVPLLKRAGGDFSAQFVRQAVPQLVENLKPHLGGVMGSGGVNERQEFAISALAAAIKQQTAVLIELRNILDLALFVYDPNTGEKLMAVNSAGRVTNVPVSLTRVLFDDAFGDDGDDDDDGDDGDEEFDDPAPRPKRGRVPMRR